MASFVVKKMSEVGSQCWSADRWFGCVDCKLLPKCKINEAKVGRLRIKQQRLAEARIRRDQETEKIRQLESDIEQGIDVWRESKLS